MDDQDKSGFFSQESSSAETLRSAASEVNSKHSGETPRKRGRPKGSGNRTKMDTPQVEDTDNGERPTYIDPEVIRPVFKSLIAGIDSYFCNKFFLSVRQLTGGDDELAKSFASEARLSSELLDAYGESAVALAKKYSGLLEYAPEFMLASCVLTDTSIKIATFKKIKELAAFVQQANKNGKGEQNQT